MPPAIRESAAKPRQRQCDSNGRRGHGRRRDPWQRCGRRPVRFHRRRIFTGHSDELDHIDQGPNNLHVNPSRSSVSAALSAAHFSISATRTSRKRPRRITGSSAWTYRSKESTEIPSERAASTRVSSTRGTSFKFSAATTAHLSRPFHSFLLSEKRVNCLDLDPSFTRSASSPKRAGLPGVAPPAPRRCSDLPSYASSRAPGRSRGTSSPCRAAEARGARWA